MVPVKQITPAKLNGQMKASEVLGEGYIPKHGSFLLGSILCFIVYLDMEV